MTAPRTGRTAPAWSLRRTDAYQARSGRFRVVDVPEMQHLVLDGAGDPNTEPFTDAVSTLYPVAYALKASSRREQGRDFVVPPLEGLWWADDVAAFTTARDKARWSWRLLIAVPGWLGPEEVAAAAGRVAAKDPPRLADVRVEPLPEGRCVQTLHVGSFDDEAEVLRRMHDEVIPDLGLVMTGPHHEVYLSDARRTPPERRRTILRQPVAPRAERTDAR